MDRARRLVALRWACMRIWARHTLYPALGDADIRGGRTAMRGVGRGLADAAKGGGKAKVDDGKFPSLTHATGCNYTKGGADPELKDDAEYPAWLWNLLEQKPTVKQLRKKMELSGLKEESGKKWSQEEFREAVLTGHFTFEDAKRLYKLNKREAIKRGNAARKK